MICFTACAHDFADSSRCVICGWDPGATSPALVPCPGCGEPFQPNDGIGGHACSTCCDKPLAVLLSNALLGKRIEQFRRVFGERLDMHAERLERLERPVDSRDAIAWEIGHAAALRGDGAESNPFRRVPQ